MEAPSEVYTSVADFHDNEPPDQTRSKSPDIGSTNIETRHQPDVSDTFETYVTAPVSRSQIMERRSQDEDTEKSDETHSVFSRRSYKYMPFDEFQHRVKEVCKIYWPNSNIDDETMEGGGYNIIIGFTVETPNPMLKAHPYICFLVNFLSMLFTRFRWKSRDNNNGKFIIRLPRPKGYTIGYQCALLQFAAAQMPTVPIPRVLAMDEGSENALKSSYMIYPRLLGDTVLARYRFLTHSQRVNLARKLGETMRQILEPRYPCAGELDVETGNIIGQFMLQTGDSDPDEDEPFLAVRPQTAIEMLHMQFDRWDQRLPTIAMPTEDLKGMATELSRSTGVFESAVYHFCHQDLMPRNILIETPGDESSLELTGVLDWDSAKFAPIVVGCKAPYWLWRWDEYVVPHGATDETRIKRTVAQVPENLEGREIKEAFESAVGPEFLRFAYGLENHMARELFTLAIRGPYSFRRAQALALIDDWEALNHRPPKSPSWRRTEKSRSPQPLDGAAEKESTGDREQWQRAQDTQDQ